MKGKQGLPPFGADSVFGMKHIPLIVSVESDSGYDCDTRIRILLQEHQQLQFYTKSL